MPRSYARYATQERYAATPCAVLFVYRATRGKRRRTMPESYFICATFVAAVAYAIRVVTTRHATYAFSLCRPPRFTRGDVARYACRASRYAATRRRQRAITPPYAARRHGLLILRRRRAAVSPPHATDCLCRVARAGVMPRPPPRSIRRARLRCRHAFDAATPRTSLRVTGRWVGVVLIAPRALRHVYAASHAMSEASMSRHATHVAALDIVPGGVCYA